MSRTEHRVPSFISPASHKVKRGFTIVEAMVALACAVFIIAGATQLFVGLFGASTVYAVSDAADAGFTYHTAPSGEETNKALILHYKLGPLMHSADECYVFGGAGQDSTAAVTNVAATPRPIVQTWAPTSLAPLSSTANAAWAKRPNPVTMYAALVAGGATAEAANAATDFTLVTYAGGAVTSVTQVRRKVIGNYACYKVALRSGVGMAVTDSYGVAVAIDKDSWALPPGATTCWYGNSAADDYGRFDAPLYRLVFPSPTLSPGHGPAPFSTFTRYVQSQR